jgi:hypothetical protein
MSEAQWPPDLLYPTGKHRRGAGTWTPTVPPRDAGGRHSSLPQPRSHVFDPPARGSLVPPVDPPARGSFPLPPPTAARHASEGKHAFPAARGELPLPEPPKPVTPAKPVKPRRTTVTLTTPPPAPGVDEDEDVRVYAAPPDPEPETEAGLSTFDLGTIPASVTPPRTWRKAAWFATASSGGVVLALLFAGSALVGKPAPNQAGDGWVPGLGGGLSTIEGDRGFPGSAEQPSSSSRSVTRPGDTSSTDPSTPSDPARRTDPRTSTDGTKSQVAPGWSSTTGPGTSSDVTSAPTTTPVPAKPKPKPAPYGSDPTRFSLNQQPDPKAYAQYSQSYLDEVTENPHAAYQMTTGSLAAQGPDGLEQKYADVAYFEVKYIQVHQYDGKTVCTVKAVRKNGEETTEQRVLTFQEGKISSDAS